MNTAVQILANSRQILPDIILKFANILPGCIHFSLRQTKCQQALLYKKNVAIAIVCCIPASSSTEGRE